MAGGETGGFFHDLNEELQQHWVELCMRLKRDLADSRIQREGDAPRCIGGQMIERFGDSDNASQ